MQPPPFLGILKNLIYGAKSPSAFSPPLVVCPIEIVCRPLPVLFNELLIISTHRQQLCLAGQDIAFANTTNKKRFSLLQIIFLRHMATQSILRNGIVSPTFALQRTSARSILKRPGALPLSPAYPYSASFSFQHSPSLQSPHVKFLPSPSLVATFTAHSARSYDRAPISVSPLERTYITSLDDFKLLAPPKPFRSIFSAQNSPAITDFEDPRSPKPKVQPAPKQDLLRFAALTNNDTATRPNKTLASSLASYPRSPYPSAPLAPSEEVIDDVETEDSHAQRVRASSLDLPRRNKKGLTLGSVSGTPFAPTPSSLGRSVFSPSVNEGKIPAPLDLESRLSEAFWKAVSLEEESGGGDDEVMYTALEYPSSWAVPPQIMYGSADGAVWSPALPKPGAAVNKIRESIMSPAGKRSSFGGSGIVRKDFTAPTPNDPFAAFPSFTAAMEVDSTITYPSRVVLE